MDPKDIVYRAKMSGYLFVYDRSGFVSVFDNPDLTFQSESENAQCIFRQQALCKSKKDFEMEIIFVHQQVTNL
jgi:hypothetical protein